MQTFVYNFFFKIVDYFYKKIYTNIIMMDCVLYDRECINCGECDMCDLDPNKYCDNCGKCIDSDSEYRAIKISEIKLNEEE